MAKKLKKRGPGRPKGARKRKVVKHYLASNCCPRCGSTDRDNYSRRIVQGPGRHGDNHPDPDRRGERYTRKMSRLTRCRNCGAWREDIEYEYAGQKVLLAEPI
jgi:hypothetical protein